MKRFLMAAAAATAVLASAAAANAATSLVFAGPAPDGSFSATFKNDGGIASGAFTDTFTFTWPNNVDGVTAGTISSSFTVSSNNLTFSSVTLNGEAFNLFDVGNTHFGSLDVTPTASGTQTLVVNGNSPGPAGSYDGHLTFTPNAVPEPATWALMITGFGAAGAMLRRKRTLALA